MPYQDKKTNLLNRNLTKPGTASASTPLLGVATSALRRTRRTLRAAAPLMPCVDTSLPRTVILYSRFSSTRGSEGKVHSFFPPFTWFWMFCYSDADCWLACRDPSRDGEEWWTLLDVDQKTIQYQYGDGDERKLQWIAQS